MNERTRWMFILLATMALWATFHPIGKILLKDISPLTLSFFRVFFALFFFIPYLAHKRQLHLPAKGDLKYVAINAGIGVFLAMGLNATGLSLSTASASAVLINTNPLFVAAIALVLGESMNGRQWLGLLLGVAGMALVVTGGNLDFAANPEYLAGNLLLLAGALCVAIATLAAAPLAHRMGAVRGQFWGIVPAVAGFFMAWVLAGEWQHLAELTPWHWAGMIWIGVMVSGVCWSLFFEGIRRLGVLTTAGFKLAVPVFAVAYAALLLGEAPTPAFWAGTALVIGGLALANRHPDGIKTTAA
ncbi:MAG: DMT family transporter [Candidatus Micrarchaeota archaeon]|nr:DMT family transporter [Candidatus Micrarchaeota archaeon]